MTSEGLADRLEGIVHRDTQVHDRGVDLTLAEVYRVETPGRIDFGGGELADASVAAVDRVWRHEDDDYHWWHLEGGQYLIEHNESVKDDGTVTVQPRDELLARGTFHPTLTVDRLDNMPLAVADGGVRLKANARISTVLAASE